LPTPPAFPYNKFRPWKFVLGYVMAGRNHFFTIVLLALLPALAVIFFSGCAKESGKTEPSVPAPGQPGEGSANPSDAGLFSGPQLFPLDPFEKDTSGASATSPGPQTRSDAPELHTSTFDLEKQKRLFREHLKKDDDFLEFFTSPAQDLDPKSLGIKPDSVIADIGCGTGTFELLLLRDKVPFTKLYTVDIDKKSLDFFRFAMEETKLTDDRIVIVHSKEDDVTLPEHSIDIVLMINTHIAMRQADRPLAADEIRKFDAFFTSLKKAMKLGARVHVFEVESLKKIKLSEENVTRPFIENGFRLISKGKFIVENSHFHMVFGL